MMNSKNLTDGKIIRASLLLVRSCMWFALDYSIPLRDTTDCFRYVGIPMLFPA